MSAVAGATAVTTTWALSRDSSSESLNDSVPEPPCRVSALPAMVLVPPVAVVTVAALATPMDAIAAAATRLFNAKFMFISTTTSGPLDHLPARSGGIRVFLRRAQTLHLIWTKG